MAKIGVSKRPVTGMVNNIPKTKTIVRPAATEKKTFLLGITLDATLSFSLVYPQVFCYLSELLRMIKSEKEGIRNTQVCYAITLLHDTPETVLFDNGGVYSNSEEEIIECLSNIDFYGGSENGYEKLTETINQQLQILNSFPKTTSAYEVQKGLIMFSDSIPKPDRMYEDFTSNEPGRYGEYQNEGIRFAKLFAYSPDFMPQFRMVNKKGKLIENEYNVCEYASIESLLGMSRKEIKDVAGQNAKSMLEAMIKE